MNTFHLAAFVDVHVFYSHSLLPRLTTQSLQSVHLFEKQAHTPGCELDVRLDSFRILFVNRGSRHKFKPRLIHRIHLNYEHRLERVAGLHFRPGTHGRQRRIVLVNAGPDVGVPHLKIEPPRGWVARARLSPFGGLGLLSALGPTFVFSRSCSSIPFCKVTRTTRRTRVTRAVRPLQPAVSMKSVKPGGLESGLPVPWFEPLELGSRWLLAGRLRLPEEPLPQPGAPGGPAARRNDGARRPPVRGPRLSDPHNVVAHRFVRTMAIDELLRHAVGNEVPTDDESVINPRQASASQIWRSRMFSVDTISGARARAPRPDSHCVRIRATAPL